ncbi:hypothetical protein [Croceitalea rosinachiae]|uniref:Signal peptidase I n=1 Tax=Croceitalea rosinachiae TaxID=3075596 RepID=A0ABU3ADR1_9FLAO|nr:hypothetical protein [Croceitalea sp. F388]MDT0608058.1 hypothetical protein [Croceitalea sp. F388]
MKKIILVFIIIILSLIFWNSFFPKTLVAGTYVSNNMEPLLEGPKGIDTLVLLENGKYENRTWGEGNYEINGSEIHFIIQYPHGEMNYYSSFSRPYFIGPPQIVLNYDLGYFYRKVQ